MSWNKYNRVCSLRQHFCYSAFCFFQQVSLDRQVKHFYDWPKILRPTVCHNFALSSNKSASVGFSMGMMPCLIYKDTSWKAVLTQCVVFPEVIDLHFVTALNGNSCKNNTPEMRKELKYLKNSKLKAHITASISVVVTSVVAVHSITAACVTVFRLHSVWHWVLWKGPCTVRTWPRTG